MTDEYKHCTTCGQECYLIKHEIPYRDEVFCSDGCLHDQILKLQRGLTFCPTCLSPLDLDDPGMIYLDIGIEFCCNECLLCYIEATDQEEQE